MSTKLHLGCGTIYLRPGWTNVDLPSPRVFLAADRPDLVEAYATTEDHYYAKHETHAKLEGFRAGPRHDQYVCDRYGSLTAIPCPDREADEVLARQVFEHLSLGEAKLALREIRRVLTSGGKLRLSVPDHEGSLRAFRETGNEILIRHLLGPRTDEFGFHLMSYTRRSLRALVESHGFEFVGEELNIHAYPALCLAWHKECGESVR